jgi:hypothetical protein
MALLKTVAFRTRRPAWQVIEECLAAYVNGLPPDEKRLVLRLARDEEESRKSE